MVMVPSIYHQKKLSWFPSSFPVKVLPHGLSEEILQGVLSSAMARQSNVFVYAR
jgi:hypothetical protein